MSIDLQALGITTDELQERIVSRAVERLFEVSGMDEDGYDVIQSSPLAGRLEKAIKAAVDKRVGEIAERHVLPITGELVENIVLQATNQWGEKTGEPVTFREYLIKRADNYLREEVNYEGKSKAEAGNSYGWNKAQSRIAHLVHAHLHYNIESAMKEAVKSANTVIVAGIQETVKLKLAEVAAQLKVEVKTK